MLTLLCVLLIIVSGSILIKSSEYVIYFTKKLAKDAKVGVFAISSIILALGTSFPELFVGITSALEKSSELALGVILGSNIANIALIGGISALVAGKVSVSGDILKKDIWIAYMAGLFPAVFLIDGTLSRVDGLILITLYLAYATGFFNSSFVKVGKVQTGENLFFRLMTKIKSVESFEKRTALDFGRLFISIAVMLLSADAIVKLSGYLAITANIPMFILGLFLLAIGTSLPELVFSAKSLNDHEPTIFFGNLLGSTVVNSTLIIGVTSLIWPIEVSNIYTYALAFIAFIIIFGLFIYFTKTKRRLDRWEALILLIAYLGFAVVEII